VVNEISPRNLARLTGFFFLIVIIAGVFAQGFVAERLIDFRNAGTTASNILANESLYRTGLTVYLIEMTAQIVMSVLLYYLLKPVSRSMALTATVLSLVGCVIKTTARVFFLAPLWVLDGGSALPSLSSDQINSLSLILLRVNDEGAAVALAFFGPATILHGWLIMKSTFLPKWLGVLALVGGIAWTTFYWPSLGRELFMVSALIALVGSVAKIGWLMIRGVDEQRWREQAAAAASSIYR
jgi:hypothetical protein